MRRRAFLATLGASTVTLAGCLGSSSASGSTDFDIGMSVSRFRPAEFAVTPGTTVVWRNTSKSTHTITAYQNSIPEAATYWASGGFDSEEAARDAWRKSGTGGLRQTETYEHTFTTPGTHNYVCIPHEPNGMVGVIVVSEEATHTPEGGRVTVTTDGAANDSTAADETTGGSTPTGAETTGG
jgi:plastocyanin